MRLAKLYYLLTLLAILFLSPISLAQTGYTTVTATLEDANGSLYVNAPFNISFYDPGTSGKLPLLNGSTFQQTYTGVNTNSSGQFSIAIADNGVIAATSGATGTQWIFSFCSAQYSNPTTKYCFSYQGTITGSTLNLTSTLIPLAPILPISGGGGLPAGLVGDLQLKANSSAFGAAHINDNGSTLTASESLSILFGGAISGSWTGSPTFSGNPTFSGTVNPLTTFNLGNSLVFAGSMVASTNGAYQSWYDGGQAINIQAGPRGKETTITAVAINGSNVLTVTGNQLEAFVAGEIVYISGTAEAFLNGQIVTVVTSSSPMTGPGSFFTANFTHATYSNPSDTGEGVQNFLRGSSTLVWPDLDQGMSTGDSGLLLATDFTNAATASSDCMFFTVTGFMKDSHFSCNTDLGFPVRTQGISWNDGSFTSGLFPINTGLTHNITWYLPDGAGASSTILCGSGLSLTGCGYTTIQANGVNVPQSVTANIITNPPLSLVGSFGGGVSTYTFSCTTCTSPTLATNGVNNPNQALLNNVPSTTNTLGLTSTPVNSSGGIVRNEIGGTPSGTWDFSGLTSMLFPPTANTTGLFYQTVQTGGTPVTQEKTVNYVAGSNMTITPSIVGGVTTLTFIASSSASTAWSAVTAATNSNAGNFIQSGNNWDFSAATWKAPIGAGYVPTTSGIFGYNSTSNLWSFGQNGVTVTLPQTQSAVSGTFLSGYNPATGTFSTATNAATSTLAATATAAATTPTLCPAGQAPIGITATFNVSSCTAYAPLAGSASISTLGTITVGTWNATIIAPLYGGTGLNTSASTGVAQVNAGTWSVSPTLANGTLATTQTTGDNTTKLATDAFVNSSITAGAGANTALSNLASVAVNLSLKPGVDATIDLDSASKRYVNAWFSGTATVGGMVTTGTDGGITLPEGLCNASGFTPSTSVDLLCGSSATGRLRANNHNGGFDNIVTASSTDILIGKTFDTAGMGNVFKINGTQLTSVSGNTAISATATTGFTTASAGTSACADGNGNIGIIGCTGGGGGGSGLVGQTASLGGGALLAGACTSGNVTITGVTANYVPNAVPLTYPGDGIYWKAYVSATNTVTVKVCGAIAATPTASVYNVSAQPGPITAGGTWSLVQSATQSCSSSTNPCTINFSALGAGNVVVIGAMGAGGTSTSVISSVNDGGSTYAFPAGANLYDAGGIPAWISGAYTLNSTAGGTSAVVTIGGTGTPNGSVMGMREYHYTGSTPTFDTANTAVDDTGTANPVAAPTLTLAGTNDLIFVFGDSYYKTISSISSPYNTSPDIVSAFSGSFISAGAIAQSSGVGPTITLSGAGTNWISTAIALKGP